MKGGDFFGLPGKNNAKRGTIWESNKSGRKKRSAVDRKYYIPAKTEGESHDPTTDMRMALQKAKKGGQHGGRGPGKGKPRRLKGLARLGRGCKEKKKKQVTNLGEAAPLRF